MASVNVLFVFVGVFLVIAGAGSSDDCQEMILGCTSRVLGNAAANFRRPPVSKALVRFSVAPGCYVADYKSCGNRISSQGVDDCLAYECINNLRHNCRGRGFDDFYDGARRDYDRMKQKCGCSNLQPSVLMVLTTLVLLALPSCY